MTNTRFPRRAQTGPLTWGGQGYRRMLLAHQALAAVQAARIRLASKGA
jgi:hypothetical protein